MAKVSLSPAALNDLRLIFDFIANDSEFYAEKVINEILNRIKSLENHNKIGQVVREFENDAIREIKVGSYRVIYRIENDNEISIARIYYSKRLLKGL